MTVTNTTDGGSGIFMRDAKVELFDVALTGCVFCALGITGATSETSVVATRCEFANSEYGAIVSGSLSSATFNNCVFHDNKYQGIEGSINATIHLYGEATAIHSNRRWGILAETSSKVAIHLPSHHNTSYNNGKEDQKTSEGGTITNVED